MNSPLPDPFLPPVQPTTSPAAGAPAPATAPPQVEGVDLSIANGPSVDFGKVFAAGKRFVVARANHGESLRDSVFPFYARASRDAGLLFSAYHFFEADEDPRDDVAAFVEATRPSELDFPIWLDCETLNARSKMQFADSLEGWIREYLAISGVKRIGLYSSYGFWTALGPYGTDSKWAHVSDLVSAAYGPSKPPVFDPWARALFHQYRGNTIWRLPVGAPPGTRTWGRRCPWPGAVKIVEGGLCDGVNDECDLDRCLGDMAGYAADYRGVAVGAIRIAPLGGGAAVGEAPSVPGGEPPEAGGEGGSA